MTYSWPIEYGMEYDRRERDYSLELEPAAGPVPFLFFHQNACTLDISPRGPRCSCSCAVGSSLLRVT